MPKEVVLQGAGQLNDPHVQQLYYRVRTGSGLKYEDPAPLRHSDQLAHYDLADGFLTIAPIVHFSSTAEAQRSFEPILRAWEMHADLKGGHPEMLRFEYEHAAIVERNPTGADSAATPLAVHMTARVSVEANLTFVLRQYPPPPVGFGYSAEVEIAVERWRQYRRGHSLESTAYFILTLLEHVAVSLGGPKTAKQARAEAARCFAIHRDILQKIGLLSSERGGPMTGRKFGRPDLSSVERQWLETATQLLIIRLGEWAAGAKLALITTTELPLPT